MGIEASPSPRLRPQICPAEVVRVTLERQLGASKGAPAANLPQLLANPSTGGSTPPVIDPERQANPFHWRSYQPVGFTQHSASWVGPVVFKDKQTLLWVLHYGASGDLGQWQPPGILGLSDLPQ